MKHFKKFDLFGEKFAFNYNGYEKYSTRMGGFIFLIFIIFSLLYFILSFIPFYKRQNLSLQFYTVNIKIDEDEKENINLEQSFFFGIECNNKANKSKIDNNLIKENFDIEMEYINDKVENNLINCPPDFFNDNDITNKIKELKLNFSDYKCLKNVENISGIFTDEKFSYYEIIVKSKGNNINNLLYENKCILQFYYKDNILDIENYTHPNKTILNSLFIQINPDFDIKKNVYFMKYHLKDEDKLIDLSILTNSEKLKTFVGLSRTEDYFIYNYNSDLNQNISKRYATLYLRADNRKTQIVRKYQNLLEFYSENTSFWIGIFEFLNIFFTFYNEFHANLSMSKKLFFFEVEENKKSNDNIKLINNSNNTENELSKINFYEKKKEEKNDEFNEKYYLKPETTLKRTETKEIKKSTIQIEDNKNFISLFEIMKISLFTCCECFEKKEKNKEKIIQKAMNIFEKKLDIYNYAKNMILIDIMYQLLIDNINNDYINFLSRSLNYLNKNDKEKTKELEAIYKPTTKLNSDYSNELFKKFSNLVKKKDKTEIEKKIISLYGINN